ncbi:MAG: ATP-binding cassette domain-containing protein [Candidatus Obscuribacterales bacterium]|nr:ATP-binding cassette domain-containing protein [Candidatus Obscuribacterales bacterium]
MDARVTGIKQLSTDRIALQTKGLRKSYKKNEALHGIDLQIKPGELFGLIGPDGAGKTTILQILAGVMDASEGEVLVLDESASKSRRKVAYVTQQFSLYPDLSIDENINYIGGLHHIPKITIQERAAQFLKETGLTKFRGRLASQLSGGMKQKLALCCALISAPKVLLLDEPTAGVDPLSRREYWETISALRTDDLTIVVATPYWDEADRCDRIALVWDGSIDNCGTPAELKKQLGVKRLLLRVNDNEKALLLLSRSQANQPNLLTDIYPLGDRIDILTKNVEASINLITDVLSDNKIKIESIEKDEPTIENVFYMHLKEKGQTPTEIPAMPSSKSAQKTGEQIQGSENKSPALSAENLRKEFGTFVAVHDLNLSVSYGEIYGLLGANGAGKTTTIQMLCGITSPSDGKVLYANKTLAKGAEHRKQIGYMSQKCTLYEDLSVAENLEFYSSIYEIPLEERQAQVDWVLNSCGLQNLSKELIAQLPKGWKQRIAFGAAIMHRPKILFLDEPTSGVDPVARREIWQMIRRLAAEGTAIIVTTHFLDEAEYCNRLGLMVAGEVIAEGSSAELKATAESKTLEDAFIKLVGSKERA